LRRTKKRKKVKKVRKSRKIGKKRKRVERKPKKKLVEGLFWNRERNGIRCHICARKCFIGKGKSGYCLVRTNIIIDFMF
jgi:uncharacterized Fe-S radical SAM superfamily protein PflX